MTDQNRNNKGQFKKGGAGGPGRPTRKVEVARELAHLGVILDRVTPEAWGEVVDKAIEQATAGDARARDWLSSFLVAESLEQVLKWRDSGNLSELIRQKQLEKSMSVSGQNGDD